MNASRRPSTCWARCRRRRPSAVARCRSSVHPAPQPSPTRRGGACTKIVIGLYPLAVIVAWFVKEELRGPTSAVFIALSVLGTVLSMLRGHLVFTAATHAVGLTAQRRCVMPITLVGDLIMAAMLAGDGLGWIMGASREVAGVLTIALAVGLVVARLVLEPTTTKAAFGD